MTISEASLIITGAGSGFGKSMALYFSQLGAKVSALDFNEDALKLLKNEDSSIATYICDVSSNEDVEKVVDHIFEDSDNVNVLVNNAGIMKNAPLVNLLSRPDSRHSVDLWSQVINVNQNGVFYMTRSVVNKMIRKRNKGVIINLSSIAAKGNIGQTAYSASKAAVEAMSKTWSKELGSFGIRSVCIAPGFINTIGTHDALEEKMLSKWIQKTPLSRTGEVREVVKAVHFVIENDFYNGETLHVNGGLVV